MSISYDNSAPGYGHEADTPARQSRARRKTPANLNEPANGFGDMAGSPSEPRSILIRVIEGEIIPRLFLAHRSQPLRGTHAAPQPRHADVLGDDEAFARLFLRGETAEIVRRLRIVISRGVGREHVYLSLIAPVGRMLGVLWEDGRCSFEDMARGLACVDAVLQEIGARTAPAEAESAAV